MSGHAQLALLAAIALPLLPLTGCAVKNDGLATSSINGELHRGGASLQSAERKFELEKVASLAEQLPICVAYRMPAKGPAINDSFISALREIARAAGGGRMPVSHAHVLHARFATDTGGSFPTSTIVELNDLLRQRFPGINSSYSPIPSQQFRKSAVCNGKDTVFVDVERLTFYRQSLPSDLTWSGGIHMGDVLFIRLDSSRKVAAASTAAKEKQND